MFRVFVFGFLSVLLCSGRVPLFSSLVGCVVSVDVIVTVDQPIR